MNAVKIRIHRIVDGREVVTEESRIVLSDGLRGSVAVTWLDSGPGTEQERFVNDVLVLDDRWQEIVR
jgi:hypothetical protein